MTGVLRSGLGWPRDDDPYLFGWSKPGAGRCGLGSTCAWEKTGHQLQAPAGLSVCQTTIGRLLEFSRQLGVVGTTVHDRDLDRRLSEENAQFIRPGGVLASVGDHFVDRQFDIGQFRLDPYPAQDVRHQTACPMFWPGFMKAVDDRMARVTG